MRYFYHIENITMLITLGGRQNSILISLKPIKRQFIILSQVVSFFNVFGLLA